MRGIDATAPRQASCWYRPGPGSAWIRAHLVLGPRHLDLVPLPDPTSASASGAASTIRVPLADVRAVHELEPPVEHGTRLEVERTGAHTFELALHPTIVEQLCDLLEATVPAPEPPARVVRRGPVRRRLALAVASVLVLATATAMVWHHGGDRRAGAHPNPSSTTTTSTTAAPSTTTTSTTTTSTTTTTPTTTTTTTVPVELAGAPLTGLPVEAWRVRRPAIVSKIDGAIPAMPAVGMELADVVLEVRIEYGYSRYLAVWHSQDPPVVGPHRSARTTDPFLLSMFGAPIFAYSGANPGVTQTLTATPWKLDASPGRAPGAYFRDESRPFPHNLFARTDELRRVDGPQLWPQPIFQFRAIDAPPPGIAVSGFVAAAGPPAQFTWDARLGGWRRNVHAREHLHADGAPVAPTNVVVLQTEYRESWADARSPEALSMGAGRAWVFSEGRVTAGMWSRTDHTRGFDLLDPLGQPMTLRRGTTWVVIGDTEPAIHVAG